MTEWSELPERARVLLDFWFGPDGDPDRECHREIWFKCPVEHDNTLRRLFLADYERAAAGELGAWEERPESALALVLLLDQIPRNIFRGTQRAYAADPLARAVADRAMARGFDQSLPPVWRRFLYMPLHHSESLDDQRRALDLFRAVPADPARRDAIDHGLRHYRTIERFGRFPHRNEILGRASSSGELAFLADPDPIFYTPATPLRPPS